jgi:hypothetical protein
MTEMEEFVALLKYTAKFYLIFLLTATASVTQQIQIQSSQPPKPAEQHVEPEEAYRPYIQ